MEEDRLYIFIENDFITNQHFLCTVKIIPKHTNVHILRNTDLRYISNVILLQTYSLIFYNFQTKL